MSHHVCDTEDVQARGNARNKAIGRLLQKVGRQNIVAPAQPEGTEDDGEYDPNEMLLEDLATDRTGGFVNISPFHMRLSKCGE